jgi:hypothetical protein
MIAPLATSHCDCCRSRLLTPVMRGRRSDHQPGDATQPRAVAIWPNVSMPRGTKPSRTSPLVKFLRRPSGLPSTGSKAQPTAGPGAAGRGKSGLARLGKAKGRAFLHSKAPPGMPPHPCFSFSAQGCIPLLNSVGPRGPKIRSAQTNRWSASAIRANAGPVTIWSISATHP